jgi:CHAT domain-containing protein
VPHSNGRGASRRRTARPQAAATPRPAPSPDRAGRGAHPEYELRDEVVERALRTGDQQGLLEDYFGADHYAELRQLSREASARGVRGGPRVLLLPGIMGSKLGKAAAVLGLFDDVYWFDPVDVAAGRLADLALRPGRPALSPLGVMLVAYLKLKLRLQIAGYDAQFHAYDWRLGLDDLGRDLARRLGRESGPIDVVAHSMGGLVARAALSQGAACRRLVMLGTPNHGSFMPVMAIRGTDPLVRKIAALDLRHTAEDLASDVLSTFPGLVQMLPTRAAFSAIDLYDVASWGDGGLRPEPSVLARAQDVQARLEPGRGNFFLVAGVEQETVTGMRMDGGAFEYEYTDAGDGTVPLAFALLPGVAATYYVSESHGSLPNSGVVARAVVDILSRGATDALPDRHEPAARTAPRAVPESALRVVPYEGRRGALVSQRELRHVLDEVASPDTRDAAARPPPASAAGGVAGALATGYRHAFDRVIVGRRRQHRVEVRFALGSITEADTRAIALGIFRGVTPVGAASALDRRLGGAITELSRRRMFSGRVGEIFMLPTGRHPVAADFVTFVGLGDFDRFTGEALQTAAENVMRTFVRARVEEFATVVFGAGSGEDPATALRNILLGFIRGMQDADRDHQFRRIVICETDRDRYLHLKEETYRLSSTAMCADVELTFDEVELPAELTDAAAPQRAPAGAAPTYLIVRREGTGAPPTRPGGGSGRRARTSEVRSSLLTAGAKATVVTGAVAVDDGALEAVRAKIVADDGADFAKLGVELGELLLADEVRTVLARCTDGPLVVVHDAALSRVPWEVLALPDGAGAPWFPAAGKGLTHRYAADNLSVAKWLENRVLGGALSVLLVANPTEDLDGAEAEAERVLELFKAQPSVTVEPIRRAAATKPALLAAFTSGRYDVIHYAGHAFFDELHPERSGILCSGSAVLSGADLAGVGNLPALVFFNACESGRLRGGARGDRAAARVAMLDRGVGFAEAFMRGGVANFLGTYWPVGDAAAKTFAEKLYGAVLAGAALGDAIQQGRAAVRETSRDWADYLFYGDPEFTVKQHA